MSTLVLQGEAGSGKIFYLSENMMLAYYALSFSLNVLATVLIAARLYWHKVQLERVFGEHHHPNFGRPSANKTDRSCYFDGSTFSRYVHFHLLFGCSYSPVCRGIRSKNGVPLHEHCDNADRICGALWCMVACVFDSLYPREPWTNHHLSNDEPDSGESMHWQGSQAWIRSDEFTS